MGTVDDPPPEGKGAEVDPVATAALQRARWLLVYLQHATAALERITSRDTGPRVGVRELLRAQAVERVDAMWSRFFGAGTLGRAERDMLTLAQVGRDMLCFLVDREAKRRQAGRSADGAGDDRRPPEVFVSSCANADRVLSEVLREAIETAAAPVWFFEHQDLEFFAAHYLGKEVPPEARHAFDLVVDAWLDRGRPSDMDSKKLLLLRLFAAFGLDDTPPEDRVACEAVAGRYYDRWKHTLSKVAEERELP